MVTTIPTAALEVQTATHARLIADPTFTGMVTGIFDAIPLGQAPPYVSYGNHISIPFPTFGGYYNHTVTFLMDIWSHAPGKEECYRILAEMIRILATRPDNPALVLPDYGTAQMLYDWATTLYEAEFHLWHMPLRFVCRVTKAP